MTLLSDETAQLLQDLCCRNIALTLYHSHA